MTTDLPNATASVCIDELLARAEHSQVNLELSCLCSASIGSFLVPPRHCSPTRFEESFSFNFATHLNSPHSMLRLSPRGFVAHRLNVRSWFETLKIVDSVS